MPPRFDAQGRGGNTAGRKPTQAGGLWMLMPSMLALLSKFKCMPVAFPSWLSWRPYSYLLDGFLLVTDGVGHPQVLAWVGLPFHHFSL